MGAYEIALKNCWDAHRLQRQLVVRHSSVQTENRYSLADMDKGMDLLIAGRATATGLNVNSNTALNSVAYLAGQRLIAETTGQLPLITYRRLSPRGRERAVDHALYYLLHDEPNPEMDAMSFKSTMTGHCVGWGNAFAEIEWDMETGVPKALWPLNVQKMKVGRDAVTKKLLYAYTLPDGQTIILPAWRVWHMPGYGFDGIIGYDTVYLAREAIGLGMALEQYGAAFFGNNASPGGVLEHPHTLGKIAQENLRSSWNEMHQGLSNAHRIAILEEGMTYKPVSISPENAQWLDAQKYSVVQVARLLNIPPHMLKDLDRATFSNIEHQGIEFVTYTMEPWFVRWQMTNQRKLLLPGEKRTHYTEYNANALLKGDTAARAAYMKERFYMASLSPNDIRELENENPINDPNADKYYVQANMIPMDMAGKVQFTQQPIPEKKSLDLAVRRIAERDKQNILRAYQKDPAKLAEYLEDYYRDFPDWMAKQLE